VCSRGQVLSGDLAAFVYTITMTTINFTQTPFYTQQDIEKMKQAIEADKFFGPGWSKPTWEEVTPKPQGTALKYDSYKAPMSLLSSEALHQTAMVLAFGKDKYAAHNWRGGFEWSRPLSAALRHILAFQDGEDRDPESGLSHLAHAMCCIMFLLEFEKTHRELDDRWKPETK
jgi:hypothetical protein